MTHAQKVCPGTVHKSFQSNGHAARVGARQCAIYAVSRRSAYAARGDEVVAFLTFAQSRHSPALLDAAAVRRLQTSQALPIPFTI
jgi:hypothetical protein